MCAIGLLVTSEEAYNADPHGRHMEILGTGALVRDDAVLTNRHVVADLEAARQRRNLQRDAIRLLFLTFPAFDNVVVSLVPVRALELVRNPTLDLGVLYIDASDPAHAARAPLVAAEDFDAVIGEPVTCLGYPFGEDALLRKAEDGSMRVYRFGPILQQGFVSAIAPFDNAEVVERLLLDLRTERGMSGAPVLRSSDGALLGLHDAGRDMAVSYAIPLSASFIRALLDAPRNPVSDDPDVWTESPTFAVPKVRRARRPA